MLPYAKKAFRRLKQWLRLASPANLVAKLRTQPLPEQALRANLASPQADMTPLARLAAKGHYNPLTKWWHYFEIYDRILGELAARSRAGTLGQPLRILEIGVWKGGSLDLWREYFGPDAIIYGIDIDERCRSLPVTTAQIRIGSQCDPSFLRSVVTEMGGIDIVIDDGSHHCKHVIESFLTLFPLLADGGSYIIEDLSTSYWPSYGGGLRRRGSSIEFLKELVDVVNSYYFAASPSRWNLPFGRESLGSIEFFDMFAVVKKKRNDIPRLFLGGSAPA